MGAIIAFLKVANIGYITTHETRSFTKAQFLEYCIKHNGSSLWGSEPQEP